MFVVDRVSRPKLIAGGMIGCVCILITECVLVARDPVRPGENKAALRAAVAMVFCMSLPASTFVALIWLINEVNSVRCLL
jgi:hypothetical protein